MKIKQSEPLLINMGGNTVKFHPRKNGRLYAIIGKGKNKETIRGFIKSTKEV